MPNIREAASEASIVWTGSDWPTGCDMGLPGLDLLTVRSIIGRGMAANGKGTRMTSMTVERDGAVASVVLPGPALSLAVKEGLLSSLRAVADDESVRAVVLTGTGKAFCVGQDLAEHAAALEKDPATSLDTVTEHYNPIVTALTTMPKPVVAAVNGTCVGAGLGFVLACDFVVMAE